MEIGLSATSSRSRVENASASAAHSSRMREWLFFVNGMVFVDLAFHRAMELLTNNIDWPVVVGHGFQPS
ncbi:hypothetical protein [Noviherbaspirillum saxi]|uniref:hypothetical protein n=1 Tax=Noviherbaspirillum saxi TaxID=2320863 RepID=UPI0011C48E6E|nr:hypothetical protein [Noviherbaspirillum saxi]